LLWSLPADTLMADELLGERGQEMSGQLFFNFAENATERSELSLFPAPLSRTIEEARVNPLTIAYIKHQLELGNSRSATIAATVLANRLASCPQDVTSLAKAHEMPLPDPSMMRNFDAAVATILATIAAKETIGLVGDYDVDGISSVAQLSAMLTSAEANHIWRIPKRDVDGYGISDRIAKDLCHHGCKTVVLFDHGTHSHHEIALLRMSGVRVVVFDHHLVGSSLPDAVVVNPAQVGCGFAAHKPCASGMAFLLCHRLAEKLDLPRPDPGLAALGTIADMVPLVGANRTIASLGLKALRQGANRGITYLANRHGIDLSALSSSDVAFYLAPTINAQGRLGDPDTAVRLLSGKAEEELHPLCAAMMRDNELRKEIQTSQLAAALGALRGSSLPRSLVAFDHSFHQGVVGLTAQGLALRYGRPSFAFAQASDGTQRGSARAGSEVYDLGAILGEAKRRDSRGIILKAGGHKAAAGVTIRGGEATSFRSLLEESVNALYPDTLNTLAVVADTTLDFNSLSAKLVRNINERLDPYGQGFEAPRFLFRDVRIVDTHELSGGRRLLFLEQGGKTHRAFVGPELWNEDFRIGTRCDLLATPTTFFSRNKHLIQLSVQALVVVEPSVVNVAPPMASTAPEPTRDLKLPAVVRGIDPLVTQPSRRHGTSASELQRRSRVEKRSLLTPYLYSDLARFEQDPFQPRELPDRIIARAEFIKRHSLTALKADSFEFRAPQIEFCRYFLNQAENVMLQAPTGSGKTEMALICAAQPCSRGARVIFAAPTIEISRQTAERASVMLDTTPVVLDGTVTPKRREAIYRDTDPRFISAVPHVLRNDLERGVFKLKKSDLLIIDEGHHTSGEYPYVPLIDAANKVGCRILFLSATPGQIEPGSSWAKLDELKSVLKVETIFPLRGTPRDLHVNAQHINLSTDIVSAIEILSRRLRSLRSETLHYLEENGGDALAREANRVLGANTLTFASGYQLDTLINQVRGMNHDRERWKVVKNLHGIGELSELYQWLAYQGISGFLLRVAEKRYECAFPTKTARGSSGKVELAAPQYLRELYSSHEVRQAYNSLARGNFVGLWTIDSLENASGLSRSHWNMRTDKERRSLFNEKIQETLRRLSDELVKLDYEDHPKESFLFDQILRRHPREQSIVYTRDRSHALFIAARLNQRFGNDSNRAVALTGLGAGTHKGVSRAARRENLDKFLVGDANVLVSTSAGNEGIDFKGLRHGYVVRGTASLIDALQQWGRLRGGGAFTYLCSGPEEHGKFHTILRKEESFYRKMSEERQAIVAQIGKLNSEGRG
jgi:single-stranded-DNA-specific exonuclease